MTNQSHSYQVFCSAVQDSIQRIEDFSFQISRNRSEGKNAFPLIMRANEVTRHALTAIYFLWQIKEQVERDRICLRNLEDLIDLCQSQLSGSIRIALEDFIEAARSQSKSK